MSSLRTILNNIKSFKDKPQWPETIGGQTDTGRLREHNEDCFGIFDDRRLFVVSDGMGGHNAGEVASALAVEIIGDCLSKRAVSEISRDRDKMEQHMVECVTRAHEAILAEGRGNSEHKGMGCTVVMAVKEEGLVHLCHVGDSRAYAVGEQGIRLLTKDHSIVRELVEAGRMSEEGAKASNLRNEITQALGAPFPITPEYGYYDLEEDQWLILCSDGLWDMLTDQQILEIVLRYDKAQPLCDELVRAANAAGGEDNITVIAVKN